MLPNMPSLGATAERPDDDDEGAAADGGAAAAAVGAVGGSCAAPRRGGSTGDMAGVNQPGVSYQLLTTLPTKWELMDSSSLWSLNRPKQARAATQLPQSGYSPLLTPCALISSRTRARRPCMDRCASSHARATVLVHGHAHRYALVGLGQTNDYVEELAVGLPAGQVRPSSSRRILPGPCAHHARVPPLMRTARASQVRSFQQAIIPNSRLVVLPYPYDEPDDWEIRLYLEPRQQLNVLIALCSALALIGAVIVLLEIRERIQDGREKKVFAPALPL